MKKFIPRAFTANVLDIKPDDKLIFRSHVNSLAIKLPIISIVKKFFYIMSLTLNFP